MGEEKLLFSFITVIKKNVLVPYININGERLRKKDLGDMEDDLTLITSFWLLFFCQFIAKCQTAVLCCHLFL